MQERAPIQDRDQIAKPARRTWGYRVAGLLLLGAGGAMLWFFACDPTGSLPGLPQYWKGGPLLLGAGFLSSCGVFLAVLKRFSLAALLVAAILSAALTAGVHSYVYSIREVEIRQGGHFGLNHTPLEDFQARSQLTITSERLKAFVQDLQALSLAGKGLSVDFECAQVSYRLANPKDEIFSDYRLIVEFTYCPYVYPKRGAGREWAFQYALLVSEWNRIWITTSGRATPSKFKLGLPKGFSYDSWESFRQNYSSTFDRQLEALCSRLKSLQPKTGATKSSAKFENEELLRILQWLHDREPDPDLQEYLEDILKDMDSGIPAISLPPYKSGLPPKATKK